MPLPLIPIISALAGGGTLVPSAAGGMIVTGATGYVAGTFISTSAISGLIGTTYAVIASGTLYFSGAAASIIGSAGIFGTTIGATGITGLLMSAGIIASTPIWVPITVGGAALCCCYGSYRLFKLKQKIKNTPVGEEAVFSESEAKLIEKVIKRLSKKEIPENEA
tara:strand:- start:60 stop:554 length:495 start_codon:yes stop_codon:yes gene_type:complete